MSGYSNFVFLKTDPKSPTVFSQCVLSDIVMFQPIVSPAEFIAERSVITVYHTSLVLKQVTMVTGDALVRCFDTDSTSIVAWQTHALRVGVVA